MSLFSIFRKRSPEQIKRDIVGKIVVTSLQFRKSVSARNNKLSADAGAEMLMLLLHLFDKAAFRVLGATSRNDVWDEVAARASIDYHEAVLTKDAPRELQTGNAMRMLRTLNVRQDIYSQCSSLLGEGFPSRGTAVFAFSYFVRLALQETERKDVDPILTGKRNISEIDGDAFPSFDVIVQNALLVAAVLKTIGFDSDLKKLS
jgi:hypothetical protein